jgi:Ca2+-binding EF-hand superfamily protein
MKWSLYAVSCFSLAIAGCLGSSSTSTPQPLASEKPTADGNVADENAADGNAAVGEDGDLGLEAPRDVDQKFGGEPDRATADRAAADGVPADGVPADGVPADGAAVLDAESTAMEPPTRPSHYGRERVCLMTDGGPLVIDIWLTIEGTPHVDALGGLIQESLTAADEDKDGRPTWDELTGSDRFRYGRTGTLEIRTEAERVELIRVYDSDRDGTVDRAELPRFLTRNAGGSRPFSLRSSNYYRDVNRIDSPIRRLLDQDHDGSIDRVEAENASTILRSRDADNNDILLPSEFRLDAETPPAPLTMNRSSLPDSAVWLTDVRQWSNFHYSLRERYALGGPLEAEHFAISAELFALLDEDKDGEVQADEMSRINDAPAHVIIAGSFGDRAVEEPSPELAEGPVEFDADAAAPAELATESLPDGPSAGDGHPSNEWHPGNELLSLVYVASELTLSTDTKMSPATAANRHSIRPGRITLNLPNTVLVLFAFDATEQGTLESQVGLQFGQLDTDGNGYLEEEEIPEDFPGLPSFVALDEDADGKVYPKDISTFFESRQSAWRKQVRCRAGESHDAMFNLLDDNDDGRLTTREIQGAAARLMTLDASGDGLDVSEIPNVMLLGVVRGDPQVDDNSYRRGMLVGPLLPTNEIPDWFRSMDRNDDNDVSRREFLGDDHQFAELDQNADQFIAADEAK